MAQTNHAKRSHLLRDKVWRRGTELHFQYQKQGRAVPARVTGSDDYTLAVVCQSAEGEVGVRIFKSMVIS
jgi:hypothetical protein